MLSMWEFGMDGGRYDVTEFRNRHLTLPALDDDSVQPESLLSRSPLQINATTKCIIEAHAILECFAGISKDTLQKAPNLIFVRAIYALVVLMKADYAVGTDPEMGEILDSQSLNEYSSRATNAALCALDSGGVEDYSAVHDYLYANQPDEGTAGPENAALVEALDSVDGPTIVAGDFNSCLGVREPAVQDLRRAFAQTPPPSRAATWYGPMGARFLLDHVFARNLRNDITVRRLPDRYGSDHHPLLTFVDVDASSSMSAQVQ